MVKTVLKKIRPATRRRGIIAPAEEFKKLISEASIHLVQSLGYSAGTVSRYMHVWKTLGVFMTKHRIKNFSAQTASKFLNAKFKNQKLSALSAEERFYPNGITALIEFHKSGKINISNGQPRKVFRFKGPIGKVIADFLQYETVEVGLATRTIRYYSNKLSVFLNYCQTHGIVSIKKINLQTIIHFFKVTHPRPKTFGIVMSSALRTFTRYLYDQGIHSKDLSTKIPRFKWVSQPQLPSIYSDKELEKLLSTIDRASAKGKRNYAVILLTMKTGLRASDVCNLKLDDIDWENDYLRLYQVKNNARLDLPLAPDVGNALIEYLKYGRLKSDHPSVFLNARAPYAPISSNVVTSLVQRAFSASGINITGRKFGAHTLRHSFVARLVANNTSPSTMSALIGHSSPNSIHYYAKVNPIALKKCALEVPMVRRVFYK